MAKRIDWNKVMSQIKNLREKDMVRGIVLIGDLSNRSKEEGNCEKGERM